MIENNDWRILYQGEYLKNKTFYFHVFEPKGNNDHEHCQFCTEKFGVDYTKAGYSTMDDCYWVCEECFEDFKEMFSFKIFEEGTFNNRTITSIIEDEVESFSNSEKVYSIKRILQLLINLKSVEIKKEKIFIEPAFVQIFIDRSPKKFFPLKPMHSEINVSGIMDLFNALEELFAKMQKKADEDKLCEAVESVYLEHKADF